LPVLTRLSGFCVLAQYINDGLIHKDSKDTLDFFETQLNTYERNPEIICSLAFVLQCIMDYHLPLEHHAFDKIDATLMFYVQNQYAKKIKTGAVRRLNEPGRCYVMPVPVDAQPNSDSSNDVLDGGHLDGDAANKSTTMINDQNQYTELINTGDVQLLNDPGSSHVMLRNRPTSVGQLLGKAKWEKPLADSITATGVGLVGQDRGDNEAERVERNDGWRREPFM
jgi:hypothetical protein